VTVEFTTSLTRMNLRYASFQHRLSAMIRDAILIVLTLGIGWVICTECGQYEWEGLQDRWFGEKPDKSI